MCVLTTAGTWNCWTAVTEHNSPRLNQYYSEFSPSQCFCYCLLSCRFFFWSIAL